ncbi:hypothetical protein MPH_08893 [Macrophomina phaseolina MS6]|uniref:Uncharacterized protein n=1 Tax=Macrophomina phaseolina (strain MS6) TaxID=1126212 RepID=K2RUN1_MACPH|nr:hypothetical protein MPH_08893 [Macrophomina phaseolina MS6]
MPDLTDDESLAKTAWRTIASRICIENWIPTWPDAAVGNSPDHPDLEFRIRYEATPPVWQPGTTGQLGKLNVTPALSASTRNLISYSAHHRFAFTWEDLHLCLTFSHQPTCAVKAQHQRGVPASGFLGRPVGKNSHPSFLQLSPKMLGHASNKSRQGHDFYITLELPAWQVSEHTNSSAYKPTKQGSA